MNPADAAVIGIILLSGIIALAIGFVRTVLIMLSWGGAALVTLWGFAPARPYGRSLIDNPLAADILTGVAVFVIALIVFYVIAHFISVRVRASAFATLDRTLGLVLGLILGCAMVSLLYLGLSWVLPPSEQPAWAREARTRPLVEAGAVMVCRMAPKEFCAQGRAAGGRAGQINDTLDPQRVFRSLGTPAAKPPAPAGETGYKQDERRELDRLLQNVGPSGVRAGETQPAAGQR